MLGKYCENQKASSVRSMFSKFGLKLRLVLKIVTMYAGVYVVNLELSD